MTGGTGTILAMGGGGFSMAADDEAARSAPLDDFLLSLVERPRGAGGLPRVCFVPTASGDSADYAARFTAAFEGRAETSVLTYSHADRIATVQIRDRTIGGAAISLTVSPRGRALQPGASGLPIAPGGGGIRTMPLPESSR